MKFFKVFDEKKSELTCEFSPQISKNSKIFIFQIILLNKIGNVMRIIFR